MLSLFELVYEKLSFTPTYNLLLIGVENSGKTELLQTIKNMNKQEIFSHSPSKIMTLDSKSPLYNTFQFNFNNLYSKSSRKFYNPTIGQNTFNFNYANNCFLKIWDIGGNLKSMWNDYYKSTHGIFFVAKYLIEIDVLKEIVEEKEEKKEYESLLTFSDEVTLSNGITKLQISIYHDFKKSILLLKDILNEYKELFKDIPIFLCINSVVTCNDNVQASDEKEMTKVIERYKSSALTEFNNIAFNEDSATNILFKDDFYKIFIKHVNVCENKKVYELVNSTVDYLHTQSNARVLLDDEYI